MVRIPGSHPRPATLRGRLRRGTSPKLWLELLLVGACFALLLCTVVWPNWIEIVLGIDPDQGDGSVEKLIVVATGVATVAFSLLVRVEWRRLRAAPA